VNVTSNWRAVYALLMVGIYALLTESCGPVMPAARARARATLTSAQVQTQLLQFHAAVLVQPGMELEQRQLVVAWIDQGVKQLAPGLPLPDAQILLLWEGGARHGWPAVRSALGPFDALQSWAVTFDALLQ
jgi:hypothetical protein